MKKISLDLDTLQVETFSTDNTEGEAGTVYGHIPSAVGNGCTAFYSCEQTVCGSSCAGGCGGSGHMTCGKYGACKTDPESEQLCWSDLC